MPDADHALNIPGVEIREVIGRGGFATVYSGFQAAFNRLVAVKVLERTELDDDARRRFDRECQVMGTLSNHPYIVTLYVAGYTSSGRPYMVMPYVGAGTLADRVRRHGPMPWEDVVTTGVRLSGALATAHHAGVLHRDIKPANVLRAEYGDLLGDFGIARIAGGHETKSGVVTASIAHAPPEVLDGDPPDARSDVYSLASTMFEALRGHAAFSPLPGSVGVGPVLRRIFTEVPAPLSPDVAPTAVDEVIQRAMSKDTADRHPTAEAFGHALRDAQRSQGLNPTDLLVLGTAAAETAEQVADVPSDATVVFDASDQPGAEPGEAGPSVSGGGSGPRPPASVETPPPRPPPSSVETIASSPVSHSATSPESSDSSSRKVDGGLLAAAVAGLVVILLIASGVFLVSGSSEDPTATDVSDTSVPSSSGGDAPDTSPSSTSSSTSTTIPSPVSLVLPPGDPVEIQMLNPRIESDVIEEMVRDFESANPEISVEIVEEGGYETSLNLVLSGEERPDVALLAEKAVQPMLDQVDYIPVQEFLDRDDFDASVLLANTVDLYSTPDGLAAMPYNIAVPMVYANLDLLGEAGLDLAPGASLTTAGLLDRCGALGDVVSTCLEYRLDRFLFTEMVTNSGGRLFDTDGFDGSAKEAAFDDDVGRDVFAFLSQTVVDGVAVPVADSRLFDDGGSAFFFDTSSGLGSLHEANLASDDPAELSAFGVPHLDGADPAGVIPGGGALWILDRGDERRAIASWLLVEHFSQLPQLLALHQSSGYVPPRSDAADDEGFLELWSRQPVFRGAFDELVAASSETLPNERDGRAGPFHEIDRAIANRLDQAQTGELGIDEAFDGLVSDVDALLSAYDASG